MAKFVNHRASNGYASPLGCTKKDGGLNFALFSQHATAVRLCLFTPGQIDPFLEVDLDPKTNRTGWIWHILICDIPFEMEYGYRLDGPYELNKGLIYNSHCLVSDPYARSLNTSHIWEDKSLKLENYNPRGRTIDLVPFEWDNIGHPRIPFKELIIYEMHVRAFTCHHSSRAVHPGTFLAIIDKIPHFKKIGVNALELMPIHEFNEKENPLVNPKTQKPLCNFWGYSTVNFFSPMNRYASSPEWNAAILEFKTLVKELHKNGIEVILDVVYNHTAEEEKYKEKYYSFRGIDNSCYYLLDSDGEYLNFSGCGNTFNCNHPTGAELILDSLRYWVSEMHVDGFRFDLASILTRGMDGKPMLNPPLIEAITNDRVLASTKLIAEPWDALGLYQVGTFPAKGRWAEWNGKFRDTFRRFIKGTDHEAGEFAKRLCGSQDLYGNGRNPFHSINFVTAHDGYTLRDLVSYQEKHNEENGQKNEDGYGDNASWNCGVEGPTKNKTIIQLRERQMRNFHLALMLSLGTPMVLMGDEYGHTRHGNNNAWCQDNDLNWFLWNHLDSEKDFFRFFCLVNAFRNTHPQLKREKFLQDEDIKWHGHRPFEPDFGPHSRFIAYTLIDPKQHEHLYIAFNAHFEPAHVTLPSLPDQKKWYRVIDTSLAPPLDFVEKLKDFPSLLLNYEMAPYFSIVAKAL